MEIAYNTIALWPSIHSRVYLFLSRGKNSYYYNKKKQWT